MTARRPHRRRGDRLIHPDQFQERNRVAADYAAGPADEWRRRMDRKWGDDRLPDLVSPDLAAKYGRQVERLHAAMTADPLDLDAVTAEAQRMVNAYRALDAAAEAAGHQPHAADVWELRIDGQRAAIVRDAALAVAWAQDHRDVQVYSLDEIGRILGADYARAVRAAKNAFPGATVTAARGAPERDPALDAVLDDVIPF